jgi:beta-glucanase (GH16 family)
MKLIAFVFSLVVLFSSCSKSSGTPDPGNPVLRSAAVTELEGTGASSFIEFTFTLSVASSKTVSARVSTKDGLAKEVEDYKKLDQVLSFAPGETTKKIKVEVVADDYREGTDNFVIALNDPVNCTLDRTTYSGTILDDDTKVVFSNAGPTSPENYPGMTLFWADEFNGTAVNVANWNYETGDGCPGVCGWGNNELEWYTGGDNVSVQSGALVIEARQETRSGKNYTSSRMTTKNKKPIKFGRIDIRAKLPIGKGIWPALWMMPQEDKYGTWPKSGEIDIMEYLGHEPNKMYSTVHYGPGPGSTNISRSVVGTAPFSDAFHVYSFIWEVDRMRFFVDDVQISEVKKADLGGNIYPFNESFFLIFNMAVGGNWPGSPDASTYFPQWLIVDYVRVFQ